MTLTNFSSVLPLYIHRTTPIVAFVQFAGDIRESGHASCIYFHISSQAGENPDDIDWSSQLIAKLQQQDANIAKLASWVRTNSKPRWQKLDADEETKAVWQNAYEQLVWNDGILCIKERVMDLKKGCKQRVIASDVMWKAILEHAHSFGTSTVHRNVEMTLQRILGWKFYWPHLRKSARTWVEECGKCSKQRKVRTVVPIFTTCVNSESLCT